MAAKTAEPQGNIAPFVAFGGAALGAAALYFGYPGFALLWLGFIVAGFLATPPLMTGFKEKTGRVWPAGPGEEKSMLAYQMWSSLKWGLIVPGKNWFPIWPGKRDRPIAWLADHRFPPLRWIGNYQISPIIDEFTTWIAVGLAVLAAAVPTRELPEGRLIDAVAVYILVAGLAAAVRSNSAPDDQAPATALADLADGITSPERRGKTIGLLIGAVLASIVVALGFAVVADRFQLWKYTVPVQLFHVSIALTLVTVGTILHLGLRRDALAEWRDLVAARAEWKPRWVSSEMKLEQAPRLIAHKRFGDDVVVDTFEASASAGAAAALFKLAPLIAIQLGSGRRVALLDVPDNDAQGQPIPGTAHPLRLRIVVWNTGQLPTLATNEIDKDLFDLAIASAMTWVITDGAKLGRPLLIQSVDIAKGPAGGDEDDDIDWDGDEEEIEAEDEPETKPAKPTPGAWATQWAFPDTPGGIGGIAAYGSALSNELGVEVIPDAAHGAVYVGALTENSPEFTDSDLAKHFKEMELEERWARRWGDILKQGGRKPLVQHAVYSEARLPLRGNQRAIVYCQPFVVPQGVSILEFIQPAVRIEPALSTTLKAAPFVSVAGFSGQGVKPGGRHQQAINVYWSETELPSTPDTVQPSENNKAASWLLGGLLNRAFDVSKLARPELISAAPLTDKTSRGHIWKMQIKLYGGVTIAEVRTQAQKLRQALNSAWLRVADGGDGVVVIVAGADPTNPGFVYAKTTKKLTNQEYVTSLEWEQAFLVSKVIGDGGAVPRLIKTDVLPNNENVQVIDFTLPAPLTRSRVKEAAAALMTATKNGFLDVRAGVDGADSVRILVSRTHPLPDSAGVDWDYVLSTVDAGKAIMPFATGVEGNPVSYDPKVDAHILIAGASGGGKSVSLQVILYPAAMHGCEIYVVDPTKGGADFGFVKPYASAFAATIEEADAVMKHVYTEVLRRKALNTSHQVGSYRDLPEDIRPQHIYLVMDEFTSLMQPDPVSKTVSDDPEVEDDRQAQLRANAAKARIGTMTGKIAREARSAGVTLVLATQKLSAKMLDTIPGAGDLKALTLDTKLPVPASDRFPTGWATNGELNVGDLVYTPDGHTTSIVGFTETVTDRDVFEVTFDDGQTVRTDAGHLWQASDERSRKRNTRGANVSADRAAVAERLLSATPEGTWNSASELAQMLGYASTARVIAHATNGGTPRGVFDRATGTVEPYVRDSRRGTAPVVFHAPTAIGMLAVSNHRSSAAFAAVTVEENTWLTARQLAALVGIESASAAGNIGTGLKSRYCPHLEQDHAPFVYDTRHFLTSVVDTLRSHGALDDLGLPLELERIVTTEQMMETISRGRGGSNWAIRVAEPFDGADVDLPVDPYVLGAWLGDGSKGTGILSSSAKTADANGLTDQTFMIQQLTAAGFYGHALDCNPELLIGTRGLKIALRAAGVLSDKRIPSTYLRASRAQRLALLQGLMDTDGTVNRNGQCIITQTKSNLAADLLELIRSLGVKATSTESPAGYVPAGETEKKITGVAHTIQFRGNQQVFRLPRKLARLRMFPDTHRSGLRYIRSITRVAAAPTRCIGVADEKHLFLVEGFIPTHNTNLSRMLMGNATFGEKQSALKNAVEAPSLGDHVPRGRGLWETSAGLAEVIQVWFEPSQATFAARIAEHRDPLPESAKVNLEALAPKPAESSAEFRDLPTAPRDQVEDLGEVEVDIDFDSLLAEMEAEEDTAAPAGAPADVEPEPEGEAQPVIEPAPPAHDLFDGSMFEPAQLTPNDQIDALILLDVDGVVAPIAAMTGDPAWGDWDSVDVPGMGLVGVSAAMTEAIGRAPAKIVWATDWADQANDVFARALGRGDLPALGHVTGEDYGWWKINSIAGYVEANPGIERVLWVDDKIDDEGPTGLSWGELAGDILEGLGAQVAFVVPDKSVGLTREDWESAAGWLNAGSADAATQPAAVAPADEPVTAAAFELELAADDVTETEPVNEPDEFLVAAPPIAAPSMFDEEFQAPVSRRVANTPADSDFDR